MLQARRVCLVFLLLAFSLGLLHATTSTSVAGFMSFDNLIPPGSGPGVNVFDIFNFTGDPGSGGFSSPPDFPIFTSLTLLSSSLLLDDGVSPFTVVLGDIVPGQFSPTDSVQFPDTQNFVSATFTATLSQTDLVLFDSSLFTANSVTLTAVMLPSSGPFLQPGTDFTLFTLSSDVPEPNTLMLVVLGFLAVFTPKLYVRLKAKA